MPPGQRCSVCRQPGHNRVTCPVAQIHRDRELKGLRAQLRLLKRALRAALGIADRERDRAEAANRHALEAEWREQDAEWGARAAEARAEAAEEKVEVLSWDLTASDRALQEFQAELTAAEDQICWLEDERDQMNAELTAAHDEAASQGMRADMAESLMKGFEAEVDSLKKEVGRLRSELSARLG
jgi:chromosome segregation ATPase